jgi:hypothetical protein
MMRHATASTFLTLGAAVFAALLVAALIPAGSAEGATQQAWYWSKERAASVARVPDHPKGCTSAIFKSGWIGNCVSPYSRSSCVGVGPRVISSTYDMYLYKAFKCRLATRTWTPAGLTAAWQHIAELVCAKQVNDPVAYNACVQDVFKNHPSFTGGIGGSALWLDGAAAVGQSTLRVQVTGRFTAIVTWLGQSWKRTIQPTG